MNRIAFRSIMVLAAAACLQCAGCSIFVKENRQLLNALDKTVQPGSTAAKVALAPVIIPVGTAAVAADAVVVNPLGALPDAGDDTVEVLWKRPSGSGFHEALLFAPKVVATPLVFVCDWAGRCLLPIKNFDH